MIEPEDSLLSPKSMGNSADHTVDPLREAILAQTLRILHQRKWMHRAKRTVAGLLLIVLGIGVGRGMFPSPPPLTIQPVVITIESPQPIPPIPSIDVIRSQSARQIELQAEQADTPAETARLYRIAGDHFLQDEGNYRSALRCYRNFLDLADAEQLLVSQSDSWLLSSLKQSRTEQRNP